MILDLEIISAVKSSVDSWFWWSQLRKSIQCLNAGVAISCSNHEIACFSSWVKFQIINATQIECSRLE